VPVSLHFRSIMENRTQMKRILKRTIYFVIANTIALTAVANAAHAADDPPFENVICATVKKTPDNFLAVRAGPTSKSAMKAKVFSGWEIVLDNRFIDGDWIKARSVYKLVNDEPVNEKTLNGWVHRDYVKIHECVC
jgi:hypothetical protein